MLFVSASGYVLVVKNRAVYFFSDFIWFMDYLTLIFYFCEVIPMFRWLTFDSVDVFNTDLCSFLYIYV